MRFSFAALSADGFERWLSFREARASVAIPTSGGVYIVRWPPFSYPPSFGRFLGPPFITKAAMMRCLTVVATVRSRRSVKINRPIL